MPEARARTVSARRALSTTRNRRAERDEGKEDEEWTVSASKSEAETWVLRLVDIVRAWERVIYTGLWLLFSREWTDGVSNAA